jgi:hypothetical protein
LNAGVALSLDSLVALSLDSLVALSLDSLAAQHCVLWALHGSLVTCHFLQLWSPDIWPFPPDSFLILDYFQIDCLNLEALLLISGSLGYPIP